MTTNIATVAGAKVTEHGPQTHMLDAMIAAQDDHGQVTWDVVSHSVTFGYVADTGTRVAVFDLDLADGMDVIRVTNWALGHTEVVPELRSELPR